MLILEFYFYVQLAFESWRNKLILNSYKIITQLTFKFFGVKNCLKHKTMHSIKSTRATINKISTMFIKTFELKIFCKSSTLNKLLFEDSKVVVFNMFREETAKVVKLDLFEFWFGKLEIWWLGHVNWTLSDPIRLNWIHFLFFYGVNHILCDRNSNAF